MGGHRAPTPRRRVCSAPGGGTRRRKDTSAEQKQKLSRSQRQLCRWHRERTDRGRGAQGRVQRGEQLRATGVMVSNVLPLERLGPRRRRGAWGVGRPPGGEAGRDAHGPTAPSS